LALSGYNVMWKGEEDETQRRRDRQGSQRDKRIRTFAHAFTPPLNPLPIAWRGDFKMRFSPPLQVLERGPGGAVSESPDAYIFAIFALSCFKKRLIERTVMLRLLPGITRTKFLSGDIHAIVCRVVRDIEERYASWDLNCTWSA